MRRGWALVGALALALVVPLGLASAFSDPDGPPAVTPATLHLLDVRGDAAAAEALTCEGEVGAPSSLPMSGTLQAARLCATHPRYERWTAPEPLTDDLDALAEALSGLEESPEHYYCFQSGGGHHYDLRLVVDDRVVSLATQPSCLEFTVGGADYLDTGSVFDAFLDGLVAQRSRREPPPLAATTALDCTPGQPWQGYALSPLGNSVDMVEAVSCWRPNSSGDTLPMREGVPVPRDTLAALVAEMRADPQQDMGFDDDPCAGQRWYQQDLLGRTHWGDVVVARGVCDTFLISDVDEALEEQSFWYPSARSQRILDRLRR